MHNPLITTAVVCLLVILAGEPIVSQVPSFTRKRFVSTGPFEYDTVASANGTKLANSSVGLLAKEIDPAEYLVGAGDVFSVTVYASQPMSVNIPVNPEGRLVLPRIGSIMVKGLLLDSVRKLVVEQSKRIYQNIPIDVSLSVVRQFKVYVLGAVAMPSVVTATPADHVFDVLESAGGILDTGSVRGIMLVREGVQQPIWVDLQRYMSFGDRSANPAVAAGDRVIVQLRNSRDVVGVSGEVPSQRLFQFMEGDSVSTVIRMAGGFLASARLDSVELVRINEQSNEIISQFIDASDWPDKLYGGKPMAGDLPLKSGDRIYVRAIPRWNERAEVVVRGEVTYPGKYAVVQDKTHLSEVIRMAGGFTDKASLDDAVVVRVSEMQIEDKEFERLKRLPPSEMSDGELQYYRTKSREVKGVMSVSFTDLFQRNITNNDPVMRDGDSVYVPPHNTYINVTGSVRTPGRIVYKPALTYLDYINLAGGYGFRADKGATLIIKTKGDQFPATSDNYTLEPGDNILVLDEPETKFIDIFREALTITAQLVTVFGVIYTVVRLK